MLMIFQKKTKQFGICAYLVEIEAWENILAEAIYLLFRSFTPFA